MKTSWLFFILIKKIYGIYYIFRSVLYVMYFISSVKPVSHAMPLSSCVWLYLNTEELHIFHSKCSCFNLQVCVDINLSPMLHPMHQPSDPTLILLPVFTLQRRRRRRREERRWLEELSSAGLIFLGQASHITPIITPTLTLALFLCLLGHLHNF